MVQRVLGDLLQISRYLECLDIELEAGLRRLGLHQFGNAGEWLDGEGVELELELLSSLLAYVVRTHHPTRLVQQTRGLLWGEVIAGCLQVLSPAKQPDGHESVIAYRLAFDHGIDDGVDVERVGEGFAHIRIVERGLSEVKLHKVDERASFRLAQHLESGPILERAHLRRW